MRKHIQKHITITDLPEASCDILTGYREWKAEALKWWFRRTKKKTN